MKTLELLSKPESLLAPQLKALKLKELERHAKKLLQRKGKAEYADVLSAVIKVVPELAVGEGSAFEAAQAIVMTYIKVGSSDAQEQRDLAMRITVILMVIIAKKFTQIHSNATSAH